MSAYSQQTAKRQKVRETKIDTEYFQGIEKVEYNNMASPAEASSWRHYHATERVHNRSMEDWTKISVSLTDFRNNGSAHYAKYLHSPWDENIHTLDNHKRCLKALLEFCAKLGVKYWTAYDTDLVPWSDNWDEIRTSWDEMVEYIGEVGQRYHVRLLWLAPDLHSHPRYAAGAFTNPDATIFTQAATQIKKCLEVAQRLNAECFLLRPCREGYESVLSTDVHKEIKLFAKLLKITAEYKDRLNYRCQLLVMPYLPHSPDSAEYRRDPERVCADRIHGYMWDVTSCLYLLRSHNLERWYRVCAPPSHHLYMASVYNMLGGVVITDDVDPFDIKQMTLMMKCFIDQGSAPPGGISLRLRPRGLDLRARIVLYMKYIECAARGLRHAAALAADQLFSKHLQQKYSSYSSGFGSRLLNNDVTMEECEDYFKKNHSTPTEGASKCQHMELAFQRYLDTCDHV